MPVFKEIPPTAGFPLRLEDLFGLITKKYPVDCLEQDFKEYLGLDYARITYSGTAALYIILEGLKELSAKRTVIIPSFICPLVPLAIKRAGFIIEVCDINKDNFDFNTGGLKELCSQNKDICAIIAVHLAGIPVELDKIREIADRHGILIIEDCAQSLGALYKGKKTGAIGDIAFFSLCRGKGLTIYEGGLIATGRKELGVIIDNKMKQIVKNDFLSEALKIFELFGYWLIYRPLLFWFAFSLPQIYWNLRNQKIKAMGDYFTLDFPIHNVSGIRKTLGHIMFASLDSRISKQRDKALTYIEALKGIAGIKIITEPAHSRATYPYLTLLFDVPAKRNEAKRTLAGLGLGVFQVYESAITDYDYLKDVVGRKTSPDGRALAERQITLSTSTFLKRKDLHKVIKIIKEIMAAAGPL